MRLYMWKAGSGLALSMHIISGAVVIIGNNVKASKNKKYKKKYSSSFPEEGTE